MFRNLAVLLNLWSTKKGRLNVLIIPGIISIFAQNN